MSDAARKLTTGHDPLLREQEALILKDAATAQVCEFDYRYYAEDGEIVTDLPRISDKRRGNARGCTDGRRYRLI